MVLVDPLARNQDLELVSTGTGKREGKAVKDDRDGLEHIFGRSPIKRNKLFCLVVALGATLGLAVWVAGYVFFDQPPPPPPPPPTLTETPFTNVTSTTSVTGQWFTDGDIVIYDGGISFTGSGPVARANTITSHPGRNRSPPQSEDEWAEWYGTSPRNRR